MERRKFLQILAAMTATSAMPRLSLALTAPFTQAGGTAPRYFVLIRMSLGWDVTLGLDPKTHADGSTNDDMYIEYTPDQIVNVGGVPLALAAAPSLLPYAGQFSVVNGVMMATVDNGHTASLEYITTGDGSGKSPYVPVEVAVAGNSGSLGVVFNSVMDASTRKMMLSSISSVVDQKNATNFSIFQNYLNAGESSDFTKAQNALIDDRTHLADLVNRLNAIPSDLSTGSVEYAARVMAAAFASGTSYEGQLDLAHSLDTHASHPVNHLKEQSAGWQDVAKIFEVFKSVPVGDGGTNLFDRTVFTVVSEFARTPALNAANGKDHNPETNSVLFAGGGVVGGKVFGASHLITKANSVSGIPSHVALPVDFTTGSVAQTRAQATAAGSSFQFVTPETIISTIAQAMQVDRSKFKSIDPATPYISSLIKSSW